MENGDYENGYATDTKDGAIITDAQLAIPFERAAQGLAIHIRVRHEFFLNRGEYRISPR